MATVTSSKSISIFGTRAIRWVSETHRICYPGCVIEGVQSYRMRVYLDGVDVTDRARITDEGMQMVVLLKLNEDSKIFPADEDGRFALEMKRRHVVILLPGEELED